jgi:ABC-2 type transport system ATP-binding protein
VSARRSRRPALAVVAAALTLALASCAADDGSGAGAPATSEATPADVPSGAGDRDGSCEQGPTLDEVRAEPVDGVASDLTVTSFDGTQLRIHWFPTATPDDDGPAPTVLMGPGWSQAGDTSEDGAALFGALGIGPLRDAGYNVLTWDPRGFGDSTGTVQINSPDAEGRDVQVLLDWVAGRPEALLDADGDPRVGMIGFSYGGGIAVTTAAVDCRVDAIVPGLAWHSLETSLYPADTFKQGWSDFLATAGGATGDLDPTIESASATARETGTIDDDDRAWFVERGPADLVADIAAPTLLVHGTVDTLFPPAEAVTNYEALRDAGTEVAMIWFCGGHGVCLTDGGDLDDVSDATFAWLDRHLKADPSVDTGPTVRVVDQDGTTWSADDLPVAPDEVLNASGSGSLALTDASVAGPVTVPEDVGGLLAGLVAPFTPAPADVALEIPVDPAASGGLGAVDGLALGAPRLTLGYSGTAPDGERPTRVFAQLVDDERDVVVGNQITPIPLVLDGELQTVEIDLEVIVQRVAPGRTLTLQLVATTPAFAPPRLDGEVTFGRIDLTVPVTTSFTEG